MVFARPASSYNAGLLCEIDRWSPSSRPRLWLLLSGASEPPENVATSNRRPRDAPNREGGFLKGISSDLRNMQTAVNFKFDNSVQNLKITKSEAFSHIDSLFKRCREEDLKPMLYYTGHGETNTGNWAFSDGTISIEEILNRKPVGIVYPTIISDACFSGRWAAFCFEKGIAGFECLSACKSNQKAYDTDEGGELTLLITGLSRFLKFGKPQTIPLFGKKTSYSPEPVNGKYVYTKLLSSILRESSEKLLSQSVYGGEFYGIFDTHSELDGDTKWWVSSWANVVDFINQGYKDNYNVYSHQIDQKTGSNYVYMMKGKHFSSLSLSPD